jgi:Tol biopolymer transport system component
MSFRWMAVLGIAATVLAAAGCSSNQAGGGSSTSLTGSSAATVPGPTTVTSAEIGAGVSTSQPGAVPGPSTSMSLPVATTLDPNGWRSQVIALVSRAMGEAEADDRSWHCTISADGRYVAFDSRADNLVPGDTNLVTTPGPGPGEPSFTRNASDIFVFDRQTGSTERVSVASDGTQGDGDSDVAFVSADGRWVVFQSEATNLVSDDTNGTTDVFVHDRQTGSTERASVGADGSEADGRSNPRGISADGRYVVFVSGADNLVPGDTNKAYDVFVRDRVTGSTQRVSVGTAGEQGNGGCWDCDISTDGRYVVFQSSASNLVPGDTNKVDDIFVRDRTKGTTERVSVSKAGAGGNHASYGGSISADGRYVAFMSSATNLVPGDTSSLRNDVFVYDRQKRSIERVSVAPGGKEGNNTSGSPAISADGQFVAFRSYASNLVQGDTNRKVDVFVRDLETHATRRVNLSAEGEQADAESLAVDLSGDGQWVAFTSMATNLVPGNTNELDDVFVARVER